MKTQLERVKQKLSSYIFIKINFKKYDQQYYHNIITKLNTYELLSNIKKIIILQRFFLYIRRLNNNVIILKN